tara:strand:+ start:439 stop:654 length:216 start_codon:yes stop_codon:yes gene_type:complete
MKKKIRMIIEVEVEMKDEELFNERIEYNDDNDEFDLEDKVKREFEYRYNLDGLKNKISEIVNWKYKLEERS